VKVEEEEEELWNFMRLECNVGQKTVFDKNLMRIEYVGLSDS
jgi:hypothetical protein